MRTLLYSNVHKTKLYKLLDIQKYFRRTLRCFEGISVAYEIEDDHISDMCYVILKVKLQCINVCEGETIILHDYYNNRLNTA